MATELRDLEADRRRLADLDCDLQTVGLSQDIAIASLDEIERLELQSGIRSRKDGWG